MRLISLAIFALVGIAPVHAAEPEYRARCSLIIDNVTYMRSEACRIDIDDDGSVRIADGDKFADVRILDGSNGTQGQGWWNGVKAASHAHDPLGVLVRYDGREPRDCFHTPWNEGAAKPKHYVKLCAMSWVRT